MCVWLGTFNLTKACVEHLKASKGAIINVSATLYYTGTPFQQHAGAAKAAVDVSWIRMGCEGIKHGLIKTIKRL
jgi:peroxisomal 2,4-dienoyl-CoA reductase